MYFWFLKVIVKFSHINEFTKNEKISRLLEILRNKKNNELNKNNGIYLNIILFKFFKLK